MRMPGHRKEELVRPFARLGIPSFVCHIPILAAIALTVGPAFCQSSDRPAVVPDAGFFLREGLVLAGSDYFRSAWRADAVELKVARGRWTPPDAGDRVDSVRVWSPVTADTSGWISHPDLRGGYLYASVDSDGGGVMLLEGMAHRTVFVNGRPRAGNVYGTKDVWESWEPPFDFSFVPIKLDPGANHLLFQGGRVSRIKARLRRPDTPLVLNTRDLTVPDLIVGEAADYIGSVALINATEETAAGLLLIAAVAGHPGTAVAVPDLPPLSVRKVGFKIIHPAPDEAGSLTVKLFVHPSLDAPAIEEESIVLAVKDPADNQRRTYVSEIDGSVQYYGLNPATNSDQDGASALVLSLHGAAVEAINHSGSYRAKTWANIVAPTNRRPYGFNWEDWGRLDALEAMNHAAKAMDVDPNRVYLTGHSMGGHGTWHLGALYPDRFAVIGPSAGWISFWSYRPRRPVDAATPLERMLMRAALPSRTTELARNYRDLGVYVIHGADDENVLADESRMMADHLSTFHRDFVYHEEPGVGHWWDNSDEDGVDCVDWPPLFDFFARHAVPDAGQIRQVEFLTPNPGISSCYQWACIITQIRSLEMSRVSIRYDPGKQRFVGDTENVEQLRLTATGGASGDSVTVSLDGQRLVIAAPSGGISLMRSDSVWASSAEPSSGRKGPHRNGTFKDAFRNRVVLVYGTGGSDAENDWALAKARYDAEQFWYQGNGGLDVVSDADFEPDTFQDRNVVLYGSATTNRAWNSLMTGSPVQVADNRLEVGERTWAGNDMGVVVIRPRQDSDVASVAAVAGTGVDGMRITNLRPYLSGGFAYPDLVVFRAGENDVDGDIVLGAGFFGNDWSVETGEFVWATR